MVDVELKTLLDDANELRQFIEQSHRSNVKAKLLECVKSFEGQIAKKRATMKPVETTGPVVRTYEIKTYAWDQSEKFVKIYVTLNGVEAHDLKNVKSEFTTQTAKITVQNFKGNHHEFSVKNLLGDIKPEDSIVKLKKDSILLMLRKVDTNEWPSLTMTQQQAKEKQESQMKPKGGETGEPGDNMMNMMKQMYETGDDDMKRNIAKAWTESRDKQANGEGSMGGMPGMPGMGGMGGMPGMGGMGGAGGAGGAGGMPDMSKLMGAMGGAGGAGGAGGMPDMSKLLGAMGGAGGAGGADGMPDMSKLLGAMGGAGGADGMPDFSKLMGGAGGAGGMPDMSKLLGAMGGADAGADK